MSEHKYNIGICLLRAVACFGVVNLHYGNRFMGNLAVPVFMMLSFFLTYSTLSNSDAHRLWKRMKRMLWPYLFWGAVYFVVYSAFNREFSFDKLLLQYAFGSAVCPPLYFMTLLMLFTLVVFLLLRIRRYGLMVMLFMVPLAYFLQYSGINYIVCKDLPTDAMYTCGRCFELLPSVAAGCGLAWVYAKKKHSAAWFGGSLLLVWLVCWQFNLIPTPLGFSYQGATSLIGAAAFLLLFTFLGDSLPTVDSSHWVVSRVANAMAGVYYVHVLVAKAGEFVLGGGASRHPRELGSVCCIARPGQYYRYE